MATYITSEGALGKCFSIAILFLAVHSAHAMPAKRNINK
jgi:hypothetical protein